ncbi:MAG: transketolase [Lachnospiraceae bacterium]|nr:transketolase [Lachnospiraceae bacterium]
MEKLEEIALDIRRSIFKTVYHNRAGHLASCLSSVEILVALYFGGVMKYNTANPNMADRDRLILSKGHVALAIYHVLAKAGYFDAKEVSTFCKEGTFFGGLTTYGKIPGIETTTGSLGHGLSFAAGVAMMGQSDRCKYNVYTLIGDGELQEGEIWEAAMFIINHKLTNHTIIIDNNGIQATGYGKDIINLEDIAQKWEAFGFSVIEVDGHSIPALLESIHKRTDKPKVIIANTIKGKGLSFAENKGDWHYKMPSEEEVTQGLLDLDMTREELSNYEK